MLLPITATAHPAHPRIRPIDIQEERLRRAALCALAAGPIIWECNRALQLEFGTRGGTDAIGHALHAALDADASSAVLQIDFANAFNSLHRATMLQAVAKRLPKVSPHVMYLYGARTRGFIIVGELEAHDYQLAAWSAPRDSLGPLLFVMMLQGPLENAAEAAPIGHILAINNDASLGHLQ
jgi:hypothetical protein